MGATLAERIIARAAGRQEVVPGEIVVAKVDLAMIHDSSGPRRIQPLLDELGAVLWDPARVVLISDHYVPAFDEATRNIQSLTRAWAQANPQVSFHDGEGICHVVLPGSGRLRPGMFAVGGDSHSPTGGAMGAYMFGIGATDMAAVLATGETWLRVPETIRVCWRGKLGAAVSAKDMMLFLCARFGLNGARYHAVEYVGGAVESLSMQERLTLSNMTAEIGGQTGLIGADAVTFEYLRSIGVDEPDSGWRSDDDARFLERHEFDAASLAPQVAAPHSPANACSVEDCEKRRVDIAYIGACTGAKLADLRMAAKVLRGRRLAPGVELLVAPASRRDQQLAAEEGIMQVFEAAGARILANACGICAGYGADRLGENVTCISSTARNFRGRMGAASSEVFLASPYTVAAAAVAGRIEDPRNLLP